MLKIISTIIIVIVCIAVLLFCYVLCALSSRVSDDIENKLVENNKELEEMLLKLTKEVERLEKENRELRK